MARERRSTWASAWASTWDRAWWLLPLLLTVACLSVFWSHATPHLCYTRYWLSGDAGNTVYNSYQVAEGRILYGDIFEFKTPLFFFLCGLMMRITGPSALAAQLLTLVCVSLVAPILAVTLRRLGVGRLFATAGSVTAVVVYFASWPFPFTPWLGWTMFALAAMALERAFHGDEYDRAWLLRAGMFSGLLVLTIQWVGFMFAGGATLALAFFGGERRWRWAAIYVGAGLLVALPFVVYFLFHGALGEAIYQTIVWPNTNYYNDVIKGDYPFAGVVDYLQRRGTCQVSPSGALNHVYTTGVLSIPGLAFVSWLATVGLAARFIIGQIRGWRGKVAVESSRSMAIAVITLGALATLTPQMLVPSLSDLPHISFAALPGIVPLCYLASRGPRAWRIASQGLIVALAALMLFTYGHRHDKWQPFGKRGANHDAFVIRYAGAQWIAELTEPGDTIVVAPYGGWQYLTTHRQSGIAHTTVFNDDRYTPRREWDKMLRNLRERQPTLLHFPEKGLEKRFFAMDPTLAQRYFWNGRAFERREPPLAHETLAPRYTSSDGEIVLEIQQTGQELRAVQAAGGRKFAMRGSVRGTRVFVHGGRVSYLLHVQPDGALTGQDRGRPIAFRPE